MHTNITKTNQLQKKWKPQQWAGISKIENHFLSVNWKLFKLNMTIVSNMSNGRVVINNIMFNGQFSFNQTWLQSSSCGTMNEPSKQTVAFL